MTDGVQGSDEVLGETDSGRDAEGDVLPPRDLVAVEDPDGPAPPPALPAAAVARARGYASASRAAATRAKYEAAWDSLAAWCAAHGHDALPGPWCMDRSSSSRQL